MNESRGRLPYSFEVGQTHAGYILESGNIRFHGDSYTASVGKEYQNGTGPTSAGISLLFLIRKEYVVETYLRELISGPSADELKGYARRNGLYVSIGIEKDTPPIRSIGAVPLEALQSKVVGVRAFDTSGRFDEERVLRSYTRFGPRGSKKHPPLPEIDPSGIKPKLEDA